MIIGVATGKKTALGIASGLAAAGLTPQNISEGLAIAIGLFVGVFVRIAADVEQEQRDKLPKRARLWLGAYMMMAGLATYAAAGWFELPLKVLPFVAGVFSFAARDWLGSIVKRGQKEIEEHDI